MQRHDGIGVFGLQQLPRELERWSDVPFGETHRKLSDFLGAGLFARGLIFRSAYSMLRC
jgi:hypothetical protein